MQIPGMTDMWGQFESDTEWSRGVTLSGEAKVALRDYQRAIEHMSDAWRSDDPDDVAYAYDHVRACRDVWRDMKGETE